MSIFRFFIYFVISCFYIQPLQAGVLPQASIPLQTIIEHDNPKLKSHKVTKKVKNHSKKKKNSLFKRFAIASGGVVFVWILFGTPSILAQLLAFLASFSALKGNFNPYFISLLISAIAGLWALIGGLFIKNQDGIEAYSVITLAIPALLFLIFACIQLFGILFGIDSANFLLSLLTILLAGTLILFAQLLGF